MDYLWKYSILLPFGSIWHPSIGAINLSDAFRIFEFLACHSRKECLKDRNRRQCSLHREQIDAVILLSNNIQSGICHKKILSFDCHSLERWCCILSATIISDSIISSHHLTPFYFVDARFLKKLITLVLKVNEAALCRLMNIYLVEATCGTIMGLNDWWLMMDEGG